MSYITKSKTFRAFSNRNYALFFTGQSISQIGTWMQRTAVAWMIYSLTGSTLKVSLVVFAQQFPSFLLSLFGGITADRYSRYKILLITQTASMIQAILLAVLILSNHYVIWEIMALSVVLGVINAFDVPARQPMIHEMVNNKEDIANALALNSAMVNMARLIGPALSGIVLKALGAGFCFSLNAISFVAVLISLLLMKFPKFVPPVNKKKVLHELEEGFQYIRKTPAIGIPVLMLTFMSLLVLPYDTLIPAFTTIFKGDAATFGYINSFIGLGAITGSLFLASMKREQALKKVLLAGAATLGIGMIIFSQFKSFPYAMPFAIIMGFGTLIPMTSCITIVQMEAASNMRGRVMSYVALCYFGMLPLGSLLVGTISEKTSVPFTMACQGIISILIAVLFWKSLMRKTRKTTPTVQVQKEALDEVQ
ncbi:MFS transporter [Taibaiella soli]|uniref:MFS transporter n=1 Tax=Taibaiella soli TaxID=1649169 RepID=A0A2W2B3X7_9BACT|nr:MFS transporter [Taibaiella soli]PZF70827.1 MFS transporter [Taibaiella soli]